MKTIRYYKLVTTVALTFFVIYSSSAQIPAPPQQTAIALTGATVHTVSGEEIVNGTVLFENGVITAVGQNIDIPGGTTLIDISGKHLYPAMIHARSSLGLSEIDRLAETVDLNEFGTINPNVRAQVAFHAESNHIPPARIHGIAAAVVTPSGGTISGMSAIMTTDGWNWEQMTYKAPAAMIINWPAMTNARVRDNTLRELQDAFDNARRYMYAKESGAGNHKTDVRLEAMIPVLKGEVPVHINADELTQIQSAVNWAEKENLKMVLVGGRDAGYLLQFLKEKSVPVILTSVIGSPSRQWEAYDYSYSLPAMLSNAGIEFCIAGDYSPAYAIRLPHHPASAIAFGLNPDEGVKSVTLYAARILGIDQQMGSIETGKDASLIITDGHLLELSTSVEQVFIQGRMIDMTDKHLRLYEKYKESYRQFDLTW